MRWPWRRRRSPSIGVRPGSVVIGTQLAAARSEEARVRAEHPTLPSPLGVRYDFWSGELDLARLVPSSIDGQIRSLVLRFLELEDEDRSRLRTSLTIDDLYTVLQFVRRSALSSLRDRDEGLATDALSAITLVDVDRVDWRDVPGPLELAAYSVSSLDLDLQQQLLRVQSLGGPKVAAMVQRLQDPAVPPSLRSAGYASVTTTHGLGLIDCWSGTDTNTLGPLLVRLADAIDADDYQTSSLTLTVDMPSVWFPKPNRARVDELADAATSAGNLSASHRPGPDADAQQLTIFVLDAGTSSAAAELEALSHGEPGLRHVQVAVASGRHFALLVARSMVQGVAGIETDESVERFREPMLNALTSDA